MSKARPEPSTEAPEQPGLRAMPIAAFITSMASGYSERM